MDTAAIGTFEVGHIFHDTQNGHIHHFRHFYSLIHNHANQLLRRSYNNNAVNRDRLENSQRNIPCAGWHINEHIVHIPPDNILPELLYGFRNNRPSPDYRICIIIQQKINRHHLNALFGFAGQNPHLCAIRLFCHTKCLGDGRACDIRIQNSCFFAPSVCQNRHSRGYHGFPNAAFPADNSNHLFDFAVFIGGYQKIRRFSAAAVGRAVAAVVRTIFTHQIHLLNFSYSFHPSFPSGKAVRIFVRSRHFPVRKCRYLRLR